MNEDITHSDHTSEVDPLIPATVAAKHLVAGTSNENNSGYRQIFNQKR